MREILHRIGRYFQWRHAGMDRGTAWAASGMWFEYRG